MKNFNKYIKDLSEMNHIELKPLPGGTHYKVHKVHPSVHKDWVKKGETLSDTHVDDLLDSGFKVKFHDK